MKKNYRIIIVRHYMDILIRLQRKKNDTHENIIAELKQEIAGFNIPKDEIDHVASTLRMIIDG